MPGGTRVVGLAISAFRNNIAVVDIVDICTGYFLSTTLIFFCTIQTAIWQKFGWKFADQIVSTWQQCKCYTQYGVQFMSDFGSIEEKKTLR